MKIDVLTYNEHIDTEAFRSKTAVVIDVLRCTSVMATALSNHASRIIPVLEPDDAFKLADSIGRDSCVIGGERGCNKVPGFDFGNSPLEYTEDAVKGKTVIMSTSNGTAAIGAVRLADTVLIGTIPNSGAVAKAAAELGIDVLILCSGTNRKPSADDYCAAGSITQKLYQIVPDCELSDLALVCVHLFDNLKNGSFDLMKTFHCHRLASLGYGSDIEYCLKDNFLDVVPVYRNGEIKSL